MKRQILERYARTHDGKVIIDITAGRVEELYNEFDKHAPYRKKDLDQELVDYIIDSVREINSEDFVIQFRFRRSTEMRLRDRVEASIHNYFLYLKEVEVGGLVNMSRTAAILLSFGIGILVLSVWVNQRIVDQETVVSRVFAEGLTVAAWVALWEALVSFLINWAPTRRKIKRYERIAKAEVIFHVDRDNTSESD